jgi:hypothetical protein
MSDTMKNNTKKNSAEAAIVAVKKASSRGQDMSFDPPVTEVVVDHGDGGQYTSDGITIPFDIDIVAWKNDTDQKLASMQRELTATKRELASMKRKLTSTQRKLKSTEQVLIMTCLLVASEL